MTSLSGKRVTLRSLVPTDFAAWQEVRRRNDAWLTPCSALQSTRTRVGSPRTWRKSSDAAPGSGRAGALSAAPAEYRRSSISHRSAHCMVSPSR